MDASWPNVSTPTQLKRSASAQMRGRRRRRGLVAGLTAALSVVAIVLPCSFLAIPVVDAQGPTISLSSPAGPAGSHLTIQVDGLPHDQRFSCEINIYGFPQLGVYHELGRATTKANGEIKLEVSVPNIPEKRYYLACRYYVPGEYINSESVPFEVTTQFDTPPFVKPMENYCGSGCSPSAINDFGVFAATIPAASNTEQAMTCAAALGECTDTSPAGNSGAYGINDSGQVVGLAKPPGSSVAGPAECQLGSTCTWTGLCAKSQKCPDYARAINATGLTIGQGYACQLAGGLCTWDSLGPNTVASAVNSSGLIVGYSVDPTTILAKASVCSYKGGTCTGGVHVIDTTKGGNSYAEGVNDSNLIAGAFIPKGGNALHAFACGYSPVHGTCPWGELPTLGGTAGTAAYGVNDDGEIVGSSYVTGNGDYHAGYWTVGAVGRVLRFRDCRHHGSCPVRDLNKQIPANSGWDLQSASAINNLEQIVGTGLYKGVPTGFFLNPTSPTGPIVSQVAIHTAGFAPASTHIIQGGTVQWLNGGPKGHSVADATGMKLFSSKRLSTMHGFVHSFPSAGTYRYADATPGSKLKGVVTVPVETAPTAGNKSTTFQVYWANDIAPKGFRYDIQIRRPGNRPFTGWLTAQTATESPFVPTAKGTYSFRARLDDTQNGKTSGWSPVASIPVR
jgi:plastocyanin/uncharacterized membrane protein